MSRARSICPVTAGVDVDAAQLLEGDHLAGGHLDHQRRGDRQAGAAHLHHEVGVAAERNDEPPNESPTITVASGTRRRRENRAVPGGTVHEALGAHRVGDAGPAGLAEVDDRVAGGGRRARRAARALRAPICDEPPRFTVTSSPETVTGAARRSARGRRSCRPRASSRRPPGRPSGRTCRPPRSCPASSRPSMCSRTVRSPRACRRSTRSAPPISSRSSSRRRRSSPTGSLASTSRSPTRQAYGRR